MDRTAAERNVDRLASEARKLRTVQNPSIQQCNRLHEILTSKLPAAWRAVHDMRAGQR